VRLAELEPVPGWAAVRVTKDPLRIEEAVPDGWGRVVFSELGTGSYELAAFVSTCPPSTRKLALAEGADTELADPIRVSCGAQIIVRVTHPELVPSSGWTVKVFSEDPQRDQADVDDGTLRGPEGWHSRPLPPGRYMVLLSDSTQTILAAEHVALEPPATELVVPLDGLTIRGRAFVGDEPVPCSLSFTNRSGARRMATTDEEGWFSVFLPRAGRWTVDWVSDPDHSFFHSQNLLQVDINPDQELEVRFKDTELTGKVVTAAGEPVAAALVTMFSSGFGQLSQVASDGNGGFSVKGLPPGEWHVQALQGSASSLMQELELRDGEVEELVLTVVHQDEFAVRVLAGDSPVSGAAVHVVPLAEQLVSLLPLPEAVTNPHGAASMRLPPGTNGLRLYTLAPGYALQAGFPQPVPKRGQTLEPQLNTVGGTLALPPGALQFWIDTPQGRLAPLVLVNGEPLPSWVLQRWAWIQGMLRQEDSVLLPMMPPGAYHLCALPAAQALGTLTGTMRAPLTACQGGSLPPGSFLTLHFPEGHDGLEGGEGR